MENLSRRGFIVHAYADKKRNRLYALGRLEDGGSFAAVETRWRPSLLIYQRDAEHCAERFRALLPYLRYEIFRTEIKSFEGDESLAALKFSSFFDRDAAAGCLEQNRISSPDIDRKPADAFLIERGIRGPVQIEGPSRPGRLVDLVFSDPELTPAENLSPLKIPLRLCSIDIETNVKTGAILAAAFSVSVWNDTENKRGLVRAVPPETSAANTKAATGNEKIIFHSSEKSMLASLLKDIQEEDPDVLTGWNFLDFDYPRLAERCAFHHIPFILGRSPEQAKFFPGAAGNSSEKNPDYLSWTDRRYSAAALVPGRQVMDALRVVRSGPRKLPGYTLEEAARTVLGIGKTVTSTGDKKIEELENLYRNNPVSFAQYCQKDAALVLDILDRTGLFRLSLERASLTGVPLDKAWTSVVSFERIYAMELFPKKIAPPPGGKNRDASGASGGTVLDSIPGFFPNVCVFDFRSLYPTIMRTFNIDPLAHAKAQAALRAAEEINGNEEIHLRKENIRAPNGALFSHEPGILPGLIASYFDARSKAIALGDEEASHVYKILMNSFYGVLGTPSCRYGKSELAGAITSFAKKWLYFSRDWFVEKGYRVIYGDTDSLFVESGLGDGASYGNFLEWGNSLAFELNRHIAKTIEDGYGRESCIELRFEKLYRRFMIPPLRNFNAGENRGRAKGYGGWLLSPEGELKIEVKGMEAVRSDSTPLARRVQIELLELVFRGGGWPELKAYVLDILKELRRGLLDGELVYRKRLSRAPEKYTASTPPQVKAARALGWKNKRGTVEYVWTLSGPEPVSLPYGPLDYDHYAGSQVLPVARSIAAAAGWNEEILPNYKKTHLSDGQMELELN